MPKGAHNKQKRIRNVAEQALKQEIKHNEEKIPEIVPDSALFTNDDDPVKAKKAKIHIVPRPELEEKPKPPTNEFYDIWGDAPAAPKKQNKRNTAAPVNPPKPSVPKSSEAYTAADYRIKSKTIKEVIEAQTEARTVDPAENVEEGEHDDGIGDSLQGDVPVVPENIDKIVPPKPNQKPMRNLILNIHIPDNIPVAQKTELRKMIRENNRIDRERREAELLPEWERIEEATKEIDARNAEIAARPPKEKKNRLDKFIADEPEFVADAKPDKLSAMPADLNPAKRMIQSLERREKVPIHG